MAAHDALRTILPVAGLDPERARTVEITGGADPVLPTPFRIGETAAAALAATGLAVSDLWRIRTGREQQVAVDLRQATASLRSGHYLKMEQTEVKHDRNPVMGMYPAKNGRWSYIHANFPNHRAAALMVLGVPEDKEAVRQAVAKWDALELEEAIIAAKGAGGMVRSMAEWAQHPQAAAIASLPLFEIVKIGDAPPEKLPQGDRPLSGIRVLDLTRVLAGPTCARTLAEHGADVLKITGAHLPNIGYQEFDTGHGKLSAHLDLRQPKDLETLKGLVREVDVFSQGYRPGTLGGRGLSPEELAKLRPGLVYVSLCAFSHVGPWASRRGFGVRRHGGAGAACPRGRQLAGADLAGANRALAGRPRRSARERAEGCAEGVRARRIAALVDRERDPGGAAAASEADGAIVRNAAPLGASLGAARLQRRGLAASSVTGRPTSASDPTLRATLSQAREGGSPSHSPFVDFFPLEALRPTAARMSALNAFASISSPS
jgi:crotonobetainyl-CoA:carnitine CoA-transferase CaiB-like acyl-CoA transferase